LSKIGAVGGRRATAHVIAPALYDGVGHLLTRNLANQESDYCAL